MEPSANALAERPGPLLGPAAKAPEAAAPRHELTRTADQYHALFHSMDQGFCVLELQFDAAGQQVVDFIYQQVNPVFSQQSGILEGVLGKSSREVMADLEPFWFDTYGRVALTGESERLEHYVPQLGRWFDVHTFRVGAQAGRQVGVLFHDVTARKQAEEQLHQAAAADAFRLRLADALASFTAPVAIQETVAHLARQHFQADHCHYGEIEGGQPIIRRDAVADGMSSVAGAYALADFALVQAAFAAGRPFCVRDVRQDALVDEGLRQLCAQLHVVSCLNVPLLKNGQPAGVLCLVQSQPRDWTAAEAALAAEVAERTWAAMERARAESALVRSEEKYRTLFASIDEGFVVSELLYDEQGRPADARMLETNPSYDRITQTTGAAGRRAKEVFPEAEIAWFETYAQVVETGESVRLESYFAPLDSWVEMYISRVGGAGSRHFASVFTDITARKRHENHTAFLDELSQALAVLNGPDEIVRATGEHLGAHLGVGFLNVCDVALAAGAEPAEARFTVTAGWERAGLPIHRSTYRAGDYLSPEFLRAARAGEAIVVHDTDTDPRVDAAGYRAVGMRALVAVPVLNNGAWPGLVSALVASPRDWRPDEVELLIEVAHRMFPRIEHARAEAARQEAHAQLVSVLESTSDAFYDLDAELRFTYINRQAARLWNRDPSTLLGQPYWEAFPQVVGSEAYRRHHEVWETGQPAHLETVSPVLGTWLDVSIYPGRRGGLSVFFRDITARKQAEEALQASQATLAAVFEALPVGVGVVNTQGQLTLANRQMQQYLPTGRLPSQDATQYARWRAYHPNGRPLARTEFPGARALRGETVVPGIEMRYTPEEGPNVWTQVISVPLPDGRSQVSGQVTVILDSTARKQAEEALRVSEVKYRTLFESMDQGFGVGEVLPAGPGRAADFRWLEVNPQVERLTGLSQASLLSGETMRVVMPELEDVWYERYEQVALTGEPVRFEQHAQVLGRWFDVYAYPLNLEGPAPHRVALLFTNITARKQAEEALRLAEERYHQKLEQRVDQRTQELQESRDLLQSVFDTNLIAMSVLKAVRDDTGAIQDFRLQLVNKELERGTGRTDLVGKLYIQESPASRDTGLFDLAVRTVETGEPQGMEYYYPHKGLDKWYACQFMKLDDGVVATNLDITERKLAEQDRARNLHLLEQAEAVAQMGSWDYNLHTHDFLWSEGMYRLFGLPLGQPVSPAIYLQVVLEEDRLLAEQLVQCLATGSAGFEDTLRLRMGEQVKTVRIKAVVLHNEAGQPGRVVGVDLDISELQRLEADNLRLRLTQQQALFEAVQAAQEQERKRMAESLHNGIGQMLYATKLRLDRLHTPVLHTLPALVAARNEANQLLSEAIRQTRTLSHELVPLVLEEFGLEAALKDIGGKMSTPRLCFRCQVQLDEDAVRLSPALQMALYRMAQELAQNIVKHARGTTEASLELETMPGWVLLRAEDNGPGFAQTTAERPGLGLRSIHGRVALLGGQLELGSLPTSGAFVRIRIPLPASPAS